jgi:hypothetical protein
MARARRVPEMSSPNGGRVYSERENGRTGSLSITWSCEPVSVASAKRLFVVGVVHIKAVCGLAFHEAHRASAS